MNHLANAGQPHRADVPDLDHDRLTQDTNPLARARTTLRTCHPEHPKYAQLMKSFSIALNKEYKATRSIEYLNENILVLRQLQELRPLGTPGSDSVCIDLARALRDVHLDTGDMPALHQSAALYREALNLRPLGHNQRQRTCAGLAAVLARLYAITDDVTFMEQANLVGEESARLRLNNQLRREEMQPEELALRLSAQSWRTGDIEALEEAIRINRNAISTYPQGHPDLAKIYSSLAGNLLQQYRRSGDASALDEIISLNRNALSLRPVGHPERARHCDFLSDALSTRYRRSGDHLLLEEAIQLGREALQLRPLGHPERPQSCTRLAGNLSRKARVDNDEELLDKAIELHEEALSLRRVGHPDRERSCSHLGAVYMQKYTLTRNIHYLDAALVMIREEVGLRPTGHRYWSHARIDFAGALFARYRLTQKEGDLQRAIELGHQAAELHARELALAKLALMYLQPLSLSFDPKMAIQCLQEVLQATPRQMPGIWPNITEALDALMNNDVLLKHTESILSVFHVAMNWLPFLAGFALDKRSQLRALKQADRIGIQALTVAIIAGNHSKGIELLERARGFMWTQALHVKDPQLDSLPHDLASELDILLRSMSGSVREADEVEANPAERDLFHRNIHRIEVILHQVRSMPGLDRFMLGLSYSELSQAALHYPVVILLATEYGCFALLIKPESIEQEPAVVHLPLTVQDLKTLVHYDTVGPRRGCPTQVHRRMDMVHPPSRPQMQLRFIWEKVVRPVIQALELKPAAGRARPRLIWCPTGDFSFLPLHAAGNHGAPNAQSCSDFVVSSYTPTITALLRAQNHQLHFTARELDILLVAEGQPLVANLPHLRSVSTELDRVTSIAHRAKATVEMVEEGTADIASVTDRLERANIVHLACHGVQDREDALESGFCLRDGNLTISRIMDLKLDRSFFAFLSACETAHGDEEQPDEVVHLAAAMLFAGFQSIVATMW
jgi:tetratricopeptide (TPR) repeat protein